VTDKFERDNQVDPHYEKQDQGSALKRSWAFIYIKYQTDLGRVNIVKAIS